MIYGVKDSANVVIKSKKTGKIVLALDYINDFTIDVKSDTVYAMKKGTKAVGWDKSKEGTSKWSCELIDPKMFSILLGSDFIAGATPISKREVLTVASSKVTIASTPRSGTLAVFTLDVDNLSHKTEQLTGTPASTQNTYSISGKDITLNSITCPDGTKVVCYYLTDSAVTASKFEVSADKFPENYEIWATTAIKQQVSGNNDFFEIYMGNAKPKSALTLTFNSDSPSKFDIEWDMFPDANNNLCTFTQIS